jgi:hypothetical protein
VRLAEDHDLSAARRLDLLDRWRLVAHRAADAHRCLGHHHGDTAGAIDEPAIDPAERTGRRCDGQPLALVFQDTDAGAEAELGGGIELRAGAAAHFDFRHDDGAFIRCLLRVGGGGAQERQRHAGQ